MTIRAGDRARGDRVAVVVACPDALAPALERCLARFADEVRGRGEVVLVVAPGGAVARRVTGVRVIRGRPGATAPELWRDGLNATATPLVAFSTAAMVPAPGWLDAMLARLVGTGAAAVGGPIEPAAGLSPTDRAVYLHRYVNYLPPVPALGPIEPPGDNAVYRRDRLSGLGHATAAGFWEAEVHRHLRARGDRLAMADGAVVTFHGGTRLGPTLKQRFRHARRFGATRAVGMSPFARRARALAAPAVPAVLLKRIAMTLRDRGRSIGPCLSAAPALAALLAAWAAGEAFGGLTGPGGGGEFIEPPRSHGAAVGIGSRGGL